MQKLLEIPYDTTAQRLGLLSRRSLGKRSSDSQHNKEVAVICCSLLFSTVALSLRKDDFILIISEPQVS